MELDLTSRQIQTLSPQMIQVMEVLQMGAQELVEYIAEIVQENPVLESEDQHSTRDEISQLRRKLEWLEATDVQNHWYHQQDAEAVRDPLDQYGSNPLDESLYFYLKSQVRFEQFPPALARVADYLMESLTSNGWLDEPVGDIAVHLGAELAIVEQAVQLVQSLEPAGVGARDLNECLRIQLERQGEDGLALTIVEHYLEAMSRDQYNLIAKETGASRTEVSEACALIRSLNPRPGRGVFRMGKFALHYPRFDGGQH